MCLIFKKKKEIKTSYFQLYDCNYFYFKMNAHVAI